MPGGKILMRPVLKVVNGATYAFQIRFKYKQWTSGNAGYRLWHTEYDPDKKVTYVGSYEIHVGSFKPPTWYVELICIYHMLLHTDDYDYVFRQLDKKPFDSDDRRNEVENIMRLLAEDEDKYEGFSERRKIGEGEQ